MLPAEARARLQPLRYDLVHAHAQRDVQDMVLRVRREARESAAHDHYGCAAAIFDELVMLFGPTRAGMIAPDRSYLAFDLVSLMAH